MLGLDFTDNKFEKKFFMDKNKVQSIISRVSDVFSKDRNHNELNAGYYNYSIYYDGRELNYYSEKHEGLNSRMKVRLRAYKAYPDGEPKKCFLEFKHRIGGVVKKERIALTNEEALTLLYTSSFQGIKDTTSRVVPIFQYLLKRYDIKPVVSVLYHRIALNSSVFPGVRLTFDSNVRASPLTNLMPPMSSFQHVVDPRQIVMELKYQHNLPHLLMSRINEFNAAQVTFSKYATSMEKVKG